MAALASGESSEKLLLFAGALEDGRLRPSTPTAVLQAVLSVPQPRLRRYAAVLHDDVDVAELVVALRSAAMTADLLSETQTVVRIAWTFPGRARPGLRTTGGVAREIIESAEKNLLVVGYSVTVDPALAGLAARTVDAMAQAAARGVVVTAVLHREANAGALLQAWNAGVPPPSIFTWPETDDPMASMHAKLLVVDRRDALVTSANLTYHGFERNFELGIRLVGPPAGEVHDRIYELIAAGEFVPWGQQAR